MHRYLDYNKGEISLGDSDLIKQYKQTINTARIFILGTFNPKTHDGSDFYYGRPRNFFWRIISAIFGVEDLRSADKETKIRFLMKHGIYILDIINSVNVENGQENNVEDSYIDTRVLEWNNICEKIINNPNLKKICFTRKTFNNIGNIENQIQIIENCANQREISFKNLISPARYCNDNKINEWRNFFN